MKRIVPWILVTLVLTVVFHVSTVKAYPYYIMVKLSKSSPGTINTITHSPRVDETARRVVRPSPNLLYSVCGYDVGEGPVRLTAPIPEDTYWSLSIFAVNTDNSFVINDRQVKSDKIEVILVDKGETVPDPGDAIVVEAKTIKGAVLFRMLIPDESRLDELISIQKQAKCEPI